MAIANYQGKKFCGENHINVNDNLVIEQALQVNINGKTFSITMRTPGNDEDLIRGLLYSEDIYKSTKPLTISFIENDEKGITEANMTIEQSLLSDGYSNSRNLLSVSSCGICGKTELEEINHDNKITSGFSIKSESLFNMSNNMKEQQTTFHLSGGSHAAAAFTKNGELLSIREDIGRHNAVDKVIGGLIKKSLLKEAKCIIVSGRISYEIVTKAFAANIPILAAVSAPSSLAVDFAKELGITVLGFCRENKATCYANPQRIG